MVFSCNALSTTFKRKTIAICSDKNAYSIVDRSCSIIIFLTAMTFGVFGGIETMIPSFNLHRTYEALCNPQARERTV